MLLNCDLGEEISAADGSNHDALIMPYLDLANIACGYHAGDHATMLTTVRLAKQHQVTIGAHPGYQDKANFGRLSINYAENALIALIKQQINDLAAICLQEQVPLVYVKPHGALYNDMMKNLEIFSLVCQAVQQVSPKLILMIQALPDSTSFTNIAQEYGLTLWFEAFADRNYLDNGLLVPRSDKNATLTDPDTIVKRILTLRKTQSLTSINNKNLLLNANTVCLHGDNPQGIAIAKALRNALKQNE